MSRPETELHRRVWRVPAIIRERESDPEAEYYLAHITSVKSVDDFLSDERIYGFAITAFGLAEMREARAFLHRVLTAGANGAKAFALELADQRLRDFAEVFDFAALGTQTTQREAARQGVVERYRDIMLEAQAGEHDEGARLALSFQRKIGSVKGIYGVLGDADLLTVVRVALGLPQSFSQQETERQAAFISGQIDLAEFGEPDRLSAFLQRFSAQWQKSRSAPSRPGAGWQDIAPMSRVLSADLLISVQAMKTGSE